MQPLDLQVIEQALEWAGDGHPVWLCTVLSTYGSAPRSPGAMLVARGDGAHVGSLSGGCVEEEFLEGLARDDFPAPAQVVRYGQSEDERQRLQLPCGGSLLVLVERRAPGADWIDHLTTLRYTLLGQHRRVRHIDLTDGALTLTPDHGGEAARLLGERVEIRIGPVLRLLLAGVSPVARVCAGFAVELGCEVIVCDPRDDKQGALAGIRVRPVMPSAFIAEGGCHETTAVVALTHDPRIDDLVLMEAVRTPAFYIGAMGSQRTSERRAERLRRVGGLDDDQIGRIHMPIGLNLGSKTPAEIALAVMADVLRVYRGKRRDAL
ncbi:MAG: XshC-Cox1 family protein [Alcanivorax sp.]|nr:XshC-Cox1 family protein [Alcanivorax sp.]UWN51977.1 putative xanthine dehydrogenase subunit A [Alcanivorax sp. ALC70]MAY12064.1 XshC-Cox1 family protein [Alcanivorax sp.]MBI56078.1 XshC-Cox1 family protein [Alcanivorax sp.]MBU57828.1 XshC-Cox1 family protein [Alcanivorax sp.]|tara:strand:- start:3998 stop:4960 length:963 start_codon:yes stop_codon:yes gene_type:complete